MGTSGTTRTRRVPSAKSVVAASSGATVREGRSNVQRAVPDFSPARHSALTTQAQPSAGETAALIELIRSERVPAVFSEAGLATELEEAIANETDARLGGKLYADALGPEGSGAETYVGSVAANAGAIATALGGSPARCELP